MNDAEYLVRKEIIATCLAMEKKGINQGHFRQCERSLARRDAHHPVRSNL